jgi:hypothetical protein
MGKFKERLVDLCPHIWRSKSGKDSVYKQCAICKCVKNIRFRALHPELGEYRP